MLGFDPVLVWCWGFNSVPMVLIIVEAFASIEYI